MITLYQFPLSHYCEKARWAMDYKKIPYQIKNLVPGPHLFITKKIAPKTSLPIIIDEEKIIQDSTQILTYLDTHFPANPLTPQDPQLAKECLEWEEYFDEKVGVHLRRTIYFYVLPHPQLAKSLILQDASMSYRCLYFFVFPMIRRLMRKTMKIFPEPTARSLQTLNEVIEKLNLHLANKDFMVGNQFTRADLTAAALFAPLCFPPNHDFRWPDLQKMPPALLDFRKQHEQDRFFKWILNLYQQYRRASYAT